ncbi:putative 4-coumarate-CoA ligase [Taphrina deformans PYCC 5710]|uniref:4-coumarate-CoA ligase n=1 Tax=Taphrina deformans (strain PYCC 5710 / ATCC 11124 / CBS 356.35 / IMI 108563 / JCM 9778 / NBRC 8474) TaxID=1097556 RepID=R4XGR1_TAPDE|nr:putative 4-coumarate-CoA ligase [Taphrina deformans PYCC 5710]|eukprot:CCG83667.1 putative 4-coumarate-CoA ligase [Taphrina deformans PYCC 5710]
MVLADIPNVLGQPFEFENKDLLSFVFDEPPVEMDFVQYIDADNEDNKLTYGGVLSLVKKIGYGLREIGLKEGDVVLGFSPNSILYPCAIYGTICAGGIFTGANPAYTITEFTHQLTHSGAKFVLADTALYPLVAEAAKKIGFSPDNIITFTPTKGARALSSLTLSGKELEWQRITDPAILKERTCIILYSSGTTGLPKGVELTHANIVANTSQSQWVRDRGNEALVREGLPEIEGQAIGHLPMYHAYGLMQSCNAALRIGTCFIVTRKFDLVQMLTIIQKYRIQFLATVPPVITLLAKHPIVEKYDLSSLRTIGSGAAPLGQEVQQALRLRTGKQCRFQQGWGMSETTCTGTSFSHADDDTEGSIGRLVPGTMAKLVDEEGRTVTGAGERGELCVQGPQVMKGYLNNPKATAETIIDGWLHTGDVAVRSKDGRRFWIVDRKKELIKSKGLQVAPAELEALLLSHEGVADACVVGVPFEGDEAPRAYLVRSEMGNALTEQELWRWMETRVARYKLLRGGVVFVPAIPKSPSGKLLRRELRDQAKKEMASKL